MTTKQIENALDQAGRHLLQARAILTRASDAANDGKVKAKFLRLAEEVESANQAIYTSDAEQFA